MKVFICCPFLKNCKALDFERDVVNVDEVLHALCANTEVPKSYISVQNGCRRLFLGDNIPDGTTLYVGFSLPGGKGGFGSMLRAIGAQIEKTTNREACRDLTGRRLRDINEEQRLKKWLAKKAEREQEAARRRKERLERLKQEPKHDFHDPEYNRQRSELPERIDDALTKGLQKAVPVLSKKRAAINDVDIEPQLKKECLSSLGVDISSESDDSDNEHPCSVRENSESVTVSSYGDTSAENSRQPFPDEEDQGCGNSAPSQSTFENSLMCCQDESNSNSCVIVSTDENSVDSVTETRGGKDSTANSAEKLPTSSAQEDDSNFSSQDLSSSSAQHVSLEAVKDATEVTEDSSEYPLADNGQQKEANSSIVQKDTDQTQAEQAQVSEKGTTDDSHVDLMTFSDSKELESLGLDKLKTVLSNMGLKCGGTLAERAQRLWSVRGLDPKDYPPAVKAKPRKR